MKFAFPTAVLVAFLGIGAPTHAQEERGQGGHPQGARPAQQQARPAQQRQQFQQQARPAQQRQQPYTLQECLHSRHGVAPRPENVLGVVSLIVWSVTMVVTVKYLGFMMRADNKGEGGGSVIVLSDRAWRQ